MSASRASSSSGRKIRRDALSSPYKRTDRAPVPDAKPKANSWSMSGIFGFMKSLGFGSWSSDEAQQKESIFESTQEDVSVHSANILPTHMSTESTNPANDLPPRVPSTSNPVAPPPRRTASRPQLNTSPALPTSSSSLSSIAVSDEASLLEWAKQKADNQSPINEVEVMGLEMFLEKQKERTYEPEKLRFGSRTPDPTLSPVSESTPSGPSFNRQSAFSGSTSLPTFTNNVPSTTAPRRMLKEDPNGPMVWRGAGRSRSTPVDRKRTTPADIPKPDTNKRRRIAEEAAASSIAPAMATSQSAPISSSNEEESTLSTPNRVLRPPVVRRRNVPFKSSPLRNVVNNSPPASPPSKSRASPTNANINGNASTSGTTNQTYSASLLAEVIEKATPPPKQPDVANPYQTAAPVKPVYKPMEKKRMSERRARTKEAEKAKEMAKLKEAEKKELTAKKIIEATVPKGAKRTRPPPGLNKTKSARSNVAPTLTNPIVGEPADESTPRKKSRTVTVEEVIECDGGAQVSSNYLKPSEIIEPQEPIAAPVRQAPVSVPSNHLGPALNIKSSTLGTGKSSLPKEPSKLRTSFLPDEEENEAPSAAVPSLSSNMTTPSAPFARVQEKKDPREIALALPLSELPTFVFRIPPPKPAAVDHAEARAFAKALPLSKLPKFDFSTAALEKIAKAPSTAPVTQAFNFGAAGTKPPTSVPAGAWQCSMCMLQNPADAIEKCSICDAPRPGATKSKAVHLPGAGFDFGAAGMRPPALAPAGAWQCSTCMLQNPDSAVEKCTICDAPRPGAEKKVAAAPAPKAMPTPPVAPKTFDWSAAGIKPAPKSNGDSWTCGTCMLSNPSTATEKCSICDAPRS